MKYGESAFDILYLTFAVVSGIVMLLKAKGKVGVKMGAAALILGGGSCRMACRTDDFRNYICADQKI